MKIWRATVSHRDGVAVVWAASKRKVLAAQRELADELEAAHYSPDLAEAVDIPTDRNGLIEWLNFHLNTDNG